MKSLFSIMGLALLIGMLFFATMPNKLLDVVTKLMPGQITPEIIQELISRQGMLFMVTTKESMNMVVRMDEGDSIFGRNRTWMSAQVAAWWGMDCAKATFSEKPGEKPVFVITLPDPELLDFRIVIASRDELHEGNPAMDLLDALKRDDPSGDMWNRFDRIVRERIETRKPSRIEALKRMDDQVQTIAALLGVEIELN